MMMQAETRATHLPPAAQQDLSRRLDIVLGQVNAIAHMIETGRSVPEVLHQLVSARSAVEEVGRRLWIEQLAQTWGIHQS